MTSAPFFAEILPTGIKGVIEFAPCNPAVNELSDDGCPNVGTLLAFQLLALILTSEFWIDFPINNKYLGGTANASLKYLQKFFIAKGFFVFP